MNMSCQTPIRRKSNSRVHSTQVEFTRPFDAGRIRHVVRRFESPTTRAASNFLLILAPPLVLFLSALSVLWQYHPLERSIFFDPGIFAYLSQLVANGYPPHKFGFNEQASLTFILGGAAMRVGDWFGIHHLIAFRIASMLVMAGVVALTYVTSAVFTRSRAVAFLAGLLMLGYHGYLLRAATALEPKSLMLVFGLTTLYFLYKRKWFTAGAFAGAAGLVWQIAWGYLIVALLLAFLQANKNFSARLRAVGMTLGAALLVFVFYFFFFFIQNAHVEMLQQTFLAPFLMRANINRPFDEHLLKLGTTFYLGFRAHVVAGILGLTGLVVWLGAHLIPNRQAFQPRAFLRRVFYFFLQNRRTAGTLLVVFGFLTYAFLDFQNYPDWIPLLPFISMYAAWFVWSICARILKRANAPNFSQRIAFVILALAVFVFSTFRLLAPNGGAPTRITWQDQERVALQVSDQLAPDAPIWLLGKAEILFFMQRVNVNKYIYLFGYVDAAADAFEPHGFRGMVRDALAQEPLLYTLARATPKKFAVRENANFINQTTKTFVSLERCRLVGGGRFYVHPDHADALFPLGAKGCLKRPG